MDATIEVNIVYVQYEQNSFEGFHLELLALTDKWKLQTKTSSFTVTQHPKVEPKVEPQVETHCKNSKDSSKVKTLTIK